MGNKRWTPVQVIMVRSAFVMNADDLEVTIFQG